MDAPYHEPFKLGDQKEQSPTLEVGGGSARDDARMIVLITAYNLSFSIQHTTSPVNHSFRYQCSSVSGSIQIYQLNYNVPR